MSMENLNGLTIAELLKAHGAVLDELKRRGVVRSKNNPTGDYAEWLAATRLGLKLETNSACLLYTSLSEFGLLCEQFLKCRH